MAETHRLTYQTAICRRCRTSFVGELIVPLNWNGRLRCPVCGGAAEALSGQAAARCMAHHMDAAEQAGWDRKLMEYGLAMGIAYMTRTPEDEEKMRANFAAVGINLPVIERPVSLPF